MSVLDAGPDPFPGPQVPLQDSAHHLGEERFQLSNGRTSPFQNVTEYLGLSGCQFMTTTENVLSDGQFTSPLHLGELGGETSREVFHPDRHIHG